MENPTVRGRDNKFGNYTATRPNVALNILPKEDLDKVNKAGVNTATELKAKFPELYKKYVEPKGLTSDFWLGNVDSQPTAPQPTPTAETLATQTYEPQIGTRNVMPMLPVDLRLPPSATSPLLKSEIQLGRIQPIKQTVEPYLAEQARQQYTAQEQLSATGLPPQIQQALMAQNLASSQMSANDAIAKVEQFNNQQQYNADIFNTQQRGKEDLANQSYAQDYQAKMLGSMANTERDLRNFYTEGNLQNRANYQSIENVNLLNAMNENYQYVPGMGVQFINTQKGNLAQPTLTQTQFENLSAQDQQIYMQNKIMATKKNNYNLQK